MEKYGKGYEGVRHNNNLVAIILRANYTSDKTTFFSPPDFSQQLGYIVYKKGGVIKAHIHNKVHREINLTQEVLFVKKGRLIVNFYTQDKKHITSRELNTGDTIFLCSGGHGFKMLEDTEMIEVKQGPYSERKIDKDTFIVVKNYDTGKRTSNR